MVGTAAHDSASDDDTLLAFFQAIATRADTDIARQLAASPGLAHSPIAVGASRQNGRKYFLTAIGHYVYAGDTALHIAAATYHGDLVRSLIAEGCDVRAPNRRGAGPLHYAADGGPDSLHWDPDSQRHVVEYLIAAGADPNALDNSGVAPLHRAVRNRGFAAASALIQQGADPLLKNKNGSTPLHLAVQNTGKRNSGSDASKLAQVELIILLLGHGADPADLDAHGKPVTAAVTSPRIRELLNALATSGS